MITDSDILKSRILIVDDQAANVDLLEQMLRGAGYETITTTRNSKAVCDLHREHRFHLIILDLQMPDLDGFQVMEDLKKLEVNCYLPVLVITAQPNHKLQALKAGAKDFVSKPFDLGEVLIRVHNMLEVRLLHLESETRTETAEAQFIEAQKMEVVGQLAGGVAHDFNNILAVIMGYSDVIQNKLDPESPIKKYLDEIQHASERAVGLTRQLLVFSRKQTVVPVVLDLNETVLELNKMLQRLIDENIELKILPGDKAGRIKADPGYIGQVLMNMVVNARDAMPAGGKLLICTDDVLLERGAPELPMGFAPGNYTMLSVADSGTGIPDEIKARLFEAFFTTKPVGKGTGLGLTTCQTIVQLSGGFISVLSELGHGTTFNIYFPRIEEPISSDTTAPVPGELPKGTETLMIVEDDPSLRHLAKEALESFGYHVLSAPNGQEALNEADRYDKDTIALVITDVIMPIMGGKVMAEWLRTSFPDLKVLFTSGYTEDALVHHGVGADGVDFLPKPYTPATLACKVRLMLDKPKTQS